MDSRVNTRGFSIYPETFVSFKDKDRPPSPFSWNRTCILLINSNPYAKTNILPVSYNK